MLSHYIYLSSISQELISVCVCVCVHCIWRTWMSLLMQLAITFRIPFKHVIQLNCCNVCSENEWSVCVIVFAACSAQVDVRCHCSGIEMELMLMLYDHTRIGAERQQNENHTKHMSNWSRFLVSVYVWAWRVVFSVRLLFDSTWNAFLALQQLHNSDNNRFHSMLST